MALTDRFDRVRLRSSELRVSEVDLRRVARVEKPLEKAARETLREVAAFARASRPQNWGYINGHGAYVGEKFDPLRRVGIYIPGGTFPLVSTVFMTVALARVAGVKEVVVCTPPPISQSLLWALKMCGVREIYRIGGAQAMAAMAYGTRTIRSVDKLFGPGNIYVTEAKRQLFGTVGIDLLAGPSELMVLADESTRIDWAACDLLAQAEHGSGRERIFCVSFSGKVLRAIEQRFQKRAAFCEKNKGLKQVLKYGCWFIQTKDRDQMVEVTNRLAPEHLQIMVRRPEQLAARIGTAGGIFLGNYTPTVLGDFVAGPSHTLPTMGAGHAMSGLRISDFIRRTSVIKYAPKSLIKASNGVKAFAQAEDLPVHGVSLAIRCH